MRTVAVASPPDASANATVTEETVSDNAIGDVADGNRPANTAAAEASDATLVDMVAGTVLSFVNTLLSPFAASTAPETPAQSPALWTLLAFARRELEKTFAQPQLAAESTLNSITNGLVADASTAVGQPIGAAAVGAAAASTAEASAVPSAVRLDAAQEPATFTGEPSIVTRVLVAVLRFVKPIAKAFGIDIATVQGSLLGSDSPPWYTTLGLNVQRGEFDGWEVWTLQSSNPSGQYVVGVHGGAFILEPTILHWLDYASMARDTGATVVVPIYPLAPKGTAATVVPQTADLISSLIDQHGSGAVSVYGDSAGGGIALAAVQELVRRGAQTPARMVLISPVLDVTLSNPAIALIDDPLLDVESGRRNGLLWAGALDPTDPLVSPLYGSLDGLPPTWVYAGSLELLAADVLRLQDNALAAGADFTFVLRKGQIHDWALPFLDGVTVRSDIYEQLFGTNTQQAVTSM